jgi:hypothetical protein
VLIGSFYTFSGAKLLLFFDMCKQNRRFFSIVGRKKTVKTPLCGKNRKCALLTKINKNNKNTAEVTRDLRL